MSKEKYKLRYIFYDILRYLAYLHILILYRPEIIYEDEVNKRTKLKNSYIIMSNHQSWLDVPMLTSVFINKRIHFSVAESVYRHKLLRPFLWVGDSYKIKRNMVDYEILNEIAMNVKNKKPLVIFPQGKITKGDKSMKFKKGVSYIAALAQTNVTPVFISKYRIFRRTKVVIGNQIDVARYVTDELNLQTIKEIIIILEEKVEHLRDMANGKLKENE